MKVEWHVSRVISIISAKTPMGLKKQNILDFHNSTGASGDHQS